MHLHDYIRDRRPTVEVNRALDCRVGGRCLVSNREGLGTSLFIVV